MDTTLLVHTTHIFKFHHPLGRPFPLPAWNLVPSQGSDLGGPPDSHPWDPPARISPYAPLLKRETRQVWEGEEGLPLLMPRVEAVLASEGHSTTSVTPSLQK